MKNLHLGKSKIIIGLITVKNPDKITKEDMEFIEAILQEIQQLAGVYIYQVEDASAGQISVALYPTGAYTASTLQTAIRTLTAAGSNSVDCSGSDVTTGGFKLA